MIRTPASLSIVFSVNRSGWSSAADADGTAEASATNRIERRAPARRPGRPDGKEDAPCGPDRAGAAQRPAGRVTHAWRRLKDATMELLYTERPMKIDLPRCVVRSFTPEDAPSIARHANNHKIW